MKALKGKMLVMLLLFLKSTPSISFFFFFFFFFVVVQSSSCVRLGNTMDSSTPASLSLTISQSLPKFMFIASVMLSSHIILWCPLILLLSIFPSIRDFSNESSVCIRWPEYYSFSFSPSSEYSELVSFNIDWSPCCPRGFQEYLQHHS